MIPVALYLFVLLELSLVSYLDVKYRKIKNAWSLLNIGVAALLFIFFPDLYPFKLEMFYFTLVFVFVGFALFILKIMGGGDSKFLATIFLVMPLEAQDKVFLYLLLATITIGFVSLSNNIYIQREKLRESVRNKDIQGVKSCFGTKFPYAPVILFTWVLMGWDLYTK